MKRNDDFNFIAAKFDEEKIVVPDSLSEEAVINKVEAAPYSKVIKNKRWKRALKIAAASAACLALIIGSSAEIYHYSTTFVPKEKNVKDGIVYFDSYGEVEKMMKSIDKANNTKNFSERFYTMKSANSFLTEEAAENKAADEYSFAETNVQVEGIDESDIIKTDGEYIYCISENRDKIIIYSANDGNPKKESTIGCKSREDYYENIFVSGKKLFILGTTSDKRFNDYKAKCFFRAYDLSNITSPEAFYEYEQSGDFLSARMFGGTVYLVSSFRDYYYSKKEILPYATNSGGSYNRIPYENYYAIKDSASLSFSIIGAIDITESESYTAKSKAIFGASQDIYCSESNIYLFGDDSGSDYPKTQIVKFSLDKTDIKIKASKKVEGELIGQYALDEKDGMLRVATTSYTARGDETNNLFILDSKLNKTGEIAGFARNESIKAVKYIGNTAYVITFEQTDPLFVIDLNDSKAPRILGEAKIDGFSTLLMPVDENCLLGIGYSTETVGYDYGDFVRTDGLKITLFDISSKLEPKIIDSKDYKNSSSSVQTDAKALISNKNQNYFAIPVQNANRGAFIIKTKDKKLSINQKKTIISPNRLTYIGDYIYAIDKSGENIEAVKA